MSLRALRSIDGLRSLRLEGEMLTSDVVEAVLDVTVLLTIEGASTLTIDLHDGQRRLLSSGIFDERVTVAVDDFVFRLVQVKKSGPMIAVTFEDEVVAKLRSVDSPRKIKPNVMSHVAFASTLVDEVDGVTFRPPQLLSDAPRTKVELARGRPGDDDQEEEREDTWTTLGRIADERGWRRFVRESQLWYMPETYLIERPVAYKIVEHQDGVDDVDFDYDVGKPIATATVMVRAGRWDVRPAEVVELAGLGPVNGRWLVKSLERSLFSLETSLRLIRARPTLPEPEGAE